MTKKIYVGNLPYDATEEQVRELFEQYGTVESVAMINDRDTGRFRGFCFVEMEDSDANRAITSLNGEDVGGRAIKVNEAKPRDDRGGRDRRGGGGRDQRGNSRERQGRRDNFPHSGGRTRR